MKYSSILLLMLSILLVGTPLSLAANIPLNFAGTIFGTCNSYADVSLQLYCPGEIGNVSCSIANSTVLSTVVGTYGVGFTYDDTTYPTGVDVFIYAVNSSCSSVAQGTNLSTNVIGGAGVVILDATMSNPFDLLTPSDTSTINNQTIEFTWSNNIVSPNSTLEIDNNSDFSSIDFTQLNILSSNVAAITTLLDGVYFWRVLTYIDSTLIQQSPDYSFILANEAPLISSITPNNSTWLTSPSVMLSMQTSIPSTCTYATTALIPYASKTVFSTTGNFTHTTNVAIPNQGANNVYLQCMGSNGKLMPFEVSTSIHRDNSIPSSSLATASLNAGSVYSTSSSVNFSWSGFNDVVSSISGYYVNITNNQGSSQGTFTSSNSLFLSGLLEGVITAYVWSVDVAGNIGTAVSDAIIVDTQPPTYSSFSTSPLNINKFTTVDLIVYITVSDNSPLILNEVRYAIGNDSLSSPLNLSLVTGSLYTVTIPNQASPNDWATRSGENLSLSFNSIDFQGFSSSENQSLFINDQFTAPVFNAISSKVVNEDAILSISLSASDVDEDTLAFSSNNSQINISSTSTSSATAQWIPRNDDVGSNIVFFTVTDGFYNVSQAVIINVSNINTPPILSTIPSLSAYEYVEFSYSINTTDVDSSSFFYSTNDSLFVISSSGNIVFTPSATNRGFHSILVSVSDGDGGFDSQNISLNVLYCGDSVCSSEYETTSSCNLDCKEDKTSQGFIINRKTCLGDSVSIHAVELVPRATCSIKGTIINDWESCTDLSDTTIIVEEDVEDSFVQVSRLITDNFGLASFTPSERGNYRLRYTDTQFDNNIVYFAINLCSEKREVILTLENKEILIDSNVTLPFFEEPLSTQQIVKLTNASKILYFILLPFLFILISFAAMNRYYLYDKEKGSGQFSKELDVWFLKYQKYFEDVSEKVMNSKGYIFLIPYFSSISSWLSTFKKYFSKGFDPLAKSKKLSLPFYSSKLVNTPEYALLLQSIYDYFHKSKNSMNFTRALQREALFPNTNLRAFSLNATKLGLSISYLFSATKDKNELLLLNEHILVKKSYPTLVDIKSELQKKHVVVITLFMNSLNKSAPHENFLAVLSGFDKNGFFMLDYSFSRNKNTHIPYPIFKRAWADSKYLECAIIKK